MVPAHVSGQVALILKHNATHCTCSTELGVEQKKPPQQGATGAPDDPVGLHLLPIPRHQGDIS